MKEPENKDALEAFRQIILDGIEVFGDGVVYGVLSEYAHRDYSPEHPIQQRCNREN
jgi:hypothetical protein